MAHKLPENDPLNKYLNPPSSNDGSSGSVVPPPRRNAFEEKKKQLPTNVLVWSGVFVALVIAMAIGTIMVPKVMEETTSNQAAREVIKPEELTLRTRALMDKILYGMSRQDVVGILGNARWASIKGDKGPFFIPSPDIGLELYWDNPGCRPIRVSFTPEPYHVVDWDEGAGDCTDQRGLPDDAKHSCQLPDRINLCR